MMISLRNVLCGIAAALVLSAAVHAQQEVSAEELQAQIVASASKWLNWSR